MDAWVDERHRVVRSGDEEWSFTLDLRAGTAAVTVCEVAYRIAPLRWAEKRRLARLAHLGEAFVTEQFWRLCVAPSDGAIAAEALALARWLSGGGSPVEALPLDASLLAKVTAETCRALGVAPMALDGLEACEVEALWRQTSAEIDQSPAQDERDWLSGSTRKIVIVPDEPAIETLAEPHTSDRESKADVPAPMARRGKVVDRAMAAGVNARPSGILLAPHPDVQPDIANDAKTISGDRLLDENPAGRLEFPPKQETLSAPQHAATGPGQNEKLRHKTEPPRLGPTARNRFTGRAEYPNAARFKMSRQTIAAVPADSKGATVTATPFETTVKDEETGEGTAASFGPFRWNVARLRRADSEPAGFTPSEQSAAKPADFAEEFAEGLRLAAADLGIVGEA